VFHRLQEKKKLNDLFSQLQEKKLDDLFHYLKKINERLQSGTIYEK